MSTEQTVQVDGGKLMQFVFRAVGEVGATLSAALVVLGDTPLSVVYGARP
jgi:hypothetical protein